MDKILLIPIFLPLVVGFALLFVSARRTTLHKLLTLVVSILAFAFAIKIFVIPDRLGYTWSILQIGDLKLDLLLTANPLSRFMLLFAMGCGFLISLHSLKATPAAQQVNTYYGSVLLAIGGSAGILLSDHLLLLLIFWEIVTVSLYLLITTGGENCKFAATKSFAMIGASDGAFLLGIVMVWAFSGTFVISDISNSRIATTSAVPIVAFLLLMTTAITKAGALPLHTWLPTSGEVMDNDEMIVSGTHFYKTISGMGGLKQLYKWQEQKWFDLYNQGGRLGLGFSSFLRWLHSGLLPMYLTWVVLGLLIILTVFGKIW